MSQDNEGINVKLVSNCFLCGSEGRPLYQNVRDRIFNAPGSWGHAICSQCQFVWLNPSPVPEDVGKLYANYPNHIPAGRPASLFARLWKTARENLMAHSLGYSISGPSLPFMGMLSRIPLFREVGQGRGMWLDASWRGRLLDVGCGNGEFISKMRAMGWAVSGVEPDPEAVKIAREHFGLEVQEGTLEQAAFQADSFDAVILHHVIEHVPAPMTLLRQCKQVLKPGGKIVVMTPNVESLAHQHFGKSWFPLQPPTHISLFSAKTLAFCARRAGLIVSWVGTSARTAGGTWYMSYLLEKNGALNGLSASPQKPSFVLLARGFFFWVWEHMQTRKRDCGEEVVMICCK